jgi:hypothetical protein
MAGKSSRLSMSFKKYHSENDTRANWKPEYKKFRVKSPIKTFRDLEIYKHTNQLSVEILQFELPITIDHRKRLSEECSLLYELSKKVPCLIAEAFGDRFNDINVGMQKLENTAQIVSSIIAKIDFLVASIDHQDTKETLNMFLKKYQIQRVKILNLKRAWERISQKQ